MDVLKHYQLDNHVCATMSHAFTMFFKVVQFKKEDILQMVIHIYNIVKSVYLLS